MREQMRQQQQDDEEGQAGSGRLVRCSGHNRRKMIALDLINHFRELCQSSSDEYNELELIRPTVEGACILRRHDKKSKGKKSQSCGFLMFNSKCVVMDAIAANKTGIQGRGQKNITKI